MQGINASSTCDLMVEAKFVPGDHINQGFKNTVNMPANFGPVLQFHIQRGISEFKGYKRELPEDIRKELVKPIYCLADPEQGDEGCETLLIHGIIGEDMINELEETSITKIGAVGMKTTRTYYGDVLHGKSHFIKFPYNKGKVDLSEEQDFAIERICQYGIYQCPIRKQEDLRAELQYLKDICE
jgi:hypothetical protein